MVDIKKLLKDREQKKKKKPDYIRQKSHQKKRLGEKWRKPKGKQSKLRLRLNGRKLLEVGYRSSKLVRGTDKEGRRIVRVENLNGLKNITKNDVIIISSKLGDKKRLMILEEIIKQGFILYENKDPKKLMDKIKKEFEERKKKKIEKQQKKKTLDEKIKKEEEKKKQKDSKKETKEEVLEDKKEKEIKEQEKILTKAK